MRHVRFGLRSQLVVVAMLVACGRGHDGHDDRDGHEVAPKPEPTPKQESGAALYAKICSVCHGAHGEGYKADQAPAIGNSGYLASVSDGFLRIAIENGRAGSVMSAWSKTHGGPLMAADVTAVLGFMRSWQRQPSIALDEQPPHGVAFTGASVFSRECAKCHGPEGPNVRLMNPQLLDTASPGFLRQAIRKGRPPTQMPAFENKLSERAIEDLVTYLTLLAKSPALQKAGVAQLPEPIDPTTIPTHPHGREPRDFFAMPKYTSVSTVARELKAGARMTFLDARAPSDYLREHIAGAVNVPFYDPEPYYASLPKQSWLICYCGCPHAESGALAQKLTAAGFEKVTVLDEGFGVWIAEGQPTREGPKP
jgi:cytochrome c oxidase cbb3-type subunit 3